MHLRFCSSKLSLENLKSSLKSHEIELDEEAPAQRTKSIALTLMLKLTKKKLKSRKTKKVNSGEGFDNELDLDELAYVTRRFPTLT